MKAVGRQAYIGSFLQKFEYRSTYKPCRELREFRAVTLFFRYAPWRYKHRRLVRCGIFPEYWFILSYNVGCC